MSGSEGERVLLEPNMRAETWCRVESDPREFWERAERRHYRNHLRTSGALLNALTGGQQRRAACIQWRLPVKLPERKHFDQSYKCHLVQTERPEPRISCSSQSCKQSKEASD
ncbi:spermatogenesis-associated protein 45 [Poecilia latipinna]|uniref:spermatogenesis-associated protein 45 n=1 Tax=Poecilia formosa TaxID=48698 RepID=UPI000444516C|nr:PREDICTED: spermatogenesis-associated protein 45-like [Poecilia formosa]XP_014902149.1 PREDICTED: spermatogenesis-associated protein 45-like [Poecilia latipinna]